MCQRGWRSREFPPWRGGKWHGRQPWETAPEQREPADYPSWRDGLSGSNESKSNERQITTLPLPFSSSVISAQLLWLARRKPRHVYVWKWRNSFLIALIFFSFFLINAVQLPTRVYHPSSATALRCYVRNQRVVICSLGAASCFVFFPFFSSKGNYISFC